MIKIPVLRWGEPYKSLEADKVVHFATGEVLAEVSRANAALVERDMRFAQRARDVLREIPIADLLQMMKKAGELYAKAELPLGDGTQTPDQFARMQSATTGLPEHMCKFNMEKNNFVLGNMDKILDSLTRGLDLDFLTRGYGIEHRGVPVSYQAQSPVLGMVLPSNSPGVHTLWLPIIPLQIGLVLKPGPQEPWTPYRMANAFIQAGVPKQAIAIYPGLGDVGAAVLAEGEVFSGANVENASYPMSVCAERNAVAAAVIAGKRSIDAVAVVSRAGEPTPPCGGCRQVLNEFGPQMLVTVESASGKRATWTLPEILPHAFGPADLGK